LFASISATGTLEPWDFEADIEGGQYQKFIDVKNNNPGTKVMIAVDGWTHNDLTTSGCTDLVKHHQLKSQECYLRRVWWHS
jgi:hypothetical protein